MVDETRIICNRYYHNPPVSAEEILKAHIDIVYVVNVDEGSVETVSPTNMFTVADGDEGLCLH